MNDFLVRSLAGAAMIALALAAAFYGGYSFAIVVAAAATAVFYEWTRITRGWGAAWYICGFVYSAVAALALLWVRDRADSGLALTLWLFGVVWAMDIGAYLSGTAIGGRKLAPAISPGKTWAGLHGGIAAATVVGAAWAWFAQLPLLLLVLAPVLAVVAQAGDLFESWMKRRAGVKDSGTWLPGHGGIFDRLDGLMPVAILTALAVMVGLL